LKPKKSFKDLKGLHSRIAPTPSGYLHLGNILSFLLTWVFVKKSGGTLTLRIDDFDQSRVRDSFIIDIFDSLDWLGLGFDRGPKDLADHKKNYSQIASSASYLDFLKEHYPNFFYACECTRKQIDSRSESGIYDRRCKELSLPITEGEHSWRFNSGNARIALKDIWGSEYHYQCDDFVLKRSDGVAGYHLVSLMEDVKLGINFIVRGHDLLDSSASQLALAGALNQGPFLNTLFFHHAMVVESGQKLAKSKKSTCLNELRKRGLTCCDVFALMANMLKLENPGDFKSASDFLALELQDYHGISYDNDSIELDQTTIPSIL
jgi:glutamyl/glutaminyl-tRNA synthetase